MDGTQLYNISYFADTLPFNFSNWSLDERWGYFSNHLEGFVILDDIEKWILVEKVSPDQLERMYEDYILQKTTGGETGEWSDFMMQIGDFLLNNFLTTEVPTTAAPEAVCSENTMIELDRLYRIFMLPVAFFFLLVLIFLQKRKYLCLDCCRGKPGLVIAVDFLSQKRLWSVVAIFGLLSYGILNLFTGILIIDFPEAYDDPWFSEKFGWTRSLLIMLNVALFCFLYYPLFACLTLRRHLAANIAGILYLTPWLSLTVLTEVLCPINNEETYRAGLLNLLFNIPVYVCYIIIYATYILDMVKNSRRLCCKFEKKKTVVHNYNLYVEGLLVASPPPQETTFLRKLIRKFKYKKVIGFKYSPRITCALVCSAFVLFKLSIYVDSGMDELGAFVKEVWGEVVGPYFVEQNSTTISDRVMEGIIIAMTELRVCMYLTFIIHLVIMLDILRVYRVNMKKMFRGDNDWHHVYEPSPPSVMVHGVRYAGYQVAYMIYGWAILTALLYIAIVVVTFLIILPLRDGYKTFLINIIIKAWPAIILSILIYIVQVLVCKFLFLQERGKYLAINNRRLFHIVDFFFFFYNVVLGFFSCLKRVLLSMVFGTLLLSRLDRCLYMRGFEQFDNGSQAYLGMMKLDLYTTHPVMRAFIHLLEEARDGYDGKPRTPEMLKRRKYRNKWYRAYTLARNPTIVLDRLQEELKDKQKKHGKMTPMGHVVDAGASFVAAVGTATLIDSAITHL